MMVVWPSIQMKNHCDKETRAPKPSFVRGVFIFALILSIGHAPAFARLLETRAECEARYGKAVREEKRTDVVDLEVLSFKKDNTDLEIAFWNGVAQQVLYDVKDSNLSPEQFRDVVLPNNAGGSSWQKAGATKCVRADGKAVADFHEALPSGVIQSTEYREAFRKKLIEIRRAETAKELKGL